MCIRDRHLPALRQAGLPESLRGALTHLRTALDDLSSDLIRRTDHDPQPCLLYTSIRHASDTGKPIFYRFQKPADDRYPAMVELFARAPDGLQPAEDSRLTPIPLDEAFSSLSAIL